MLQVFGQALFKHWKKELADRDPVKSEGLTLIRCQFHAVPEKSLAGQHGFFIILLKNRMTA